MPDKERVGNLEILHIEHDTWGELERRFAGYEENSPWQNIIQLVKKHSCKTIIIESNYIDKDYLDEYSHFYSITFKTYDRTCNRIHFFSCILSADNLYKVLNNIQSQQENDDYIGFCIIRPTDTNRISRTVIKPKISDKNKDFVLCTAKFEVNLHGFLLVVKAMPFIQQDSQVCMCAQASLWMAIQYMHARYSFPNYSPYDITNNATRTYSLGRIMPSAGLDITQMLEVLRIKECSPVLYSRKTESDSIDRKKKELENIQLKRAIYRYVESGIPVILCLKLSRDENISYHAAVVIGHTYNNNERPSLYKIGDLSYYDSADWVDKFYIHDDSLGLYETLSITATDSPYSMNDIEHVIVPSLRKVYLLGDEIELNLELVYQLVKVHCGNNIMPSDIVFRTYFRSSNSYKLSLQQSDMDVLLKEIYRGMEMPKYIWITEISTKKMMNEKNKDDRKMIGEIITDPTTNSQAPSFLSIHVPGFLLLRDFQSEEPQFINGIEKIHIEKIQIKDDEPYGHYVR